MLEVKGDIWRCHGSGEWVVVTTNGATRRDGACIMGRGVALQAAQLYPKLPFELGDRIRMFGNLVFLFDDRKIASFPVKYSWEQKADLKLIESSARQLSVHVREKEIPVIYLPRPGCGNGRLDWEREVKPVLSKILNDRFVVLEKDVS
jgi:hypothetical protein